MNLPNVISLEILSKVQPIIFFTGSSFVNSTASAVALEDKVIVSFSRRRLEALVRFNTSWGRGGSIKFLTCSTWHGSRRWCWIGVLGFDRYPDLTFKGSCIRLRRLIGGNWFIRSSLHYLWKSLICRDRPFERLSAQVCAQGSPIVWVNVLVQIPILVESRVLMKLICSTICTIANVLTTSWRLSNKGFRRSFKSIRTLSRATSCKILSLRRSR